MDAVACRSAALTERPKRSIKLLNHTHYHSAVTALVVAWLLCYGTPARGIRSRLNASFNSKPTYRLKDGYVPSVGG
jgi:hypothetical protein